MMCRLKERLKALPGESLCRTVPAEPLPACWRRSIRPLIGSDSRNVSPSASRLPENLRYLSELARPSQSPRRQLLWKNRQPTVVNRSCPRNDLTPRLRTPCTLGKAIRALLAVRQSTPASTIRTVSTAANTYQRRLPVLWDVSKSFCAVFDDPKALF